MRGALVLSMMACSASLLGAQGVRISLWAGRESVLMDTLRQDKELKATPARVYEATLQAFAALDIPVGNTSSTAGIIGSERFERIRALGGTMLSKSFDCGEGPAGPKANFYRLDIAVAAYVSPIPGSERTRFGLAVVASGRDPTGPYSTPRQCASTGALETKIVEKVRQITGG
jgi:hypothetical protein